MKKTIGILAHVDAGKTTLAEQILYKTKAIRKLGRVDHKDSFLDSNEIEKRRGITIFSDIGTFKYEENEYYLLDTPGHVDFSQEMERTLDVLDYAILVISAVEGIQGHTESIIDILKKRNIKTFIFINKMDRENERYNEILEELKKRYSYNIIEFNNKINDELGNEVIEEVASLDEELLEKFLNGEFKDDIWKEEIKKLFNNAIVTPVFKGTALQGSGVDEFLEWMNYLTHTNYREEGEFKGKIFKIRYDEKMRRLVYIKALEGSLKSKDVVRVKIKEEEVLEKINELNLVNGDKFIKKDIVKAGDIFAVEGLKYAKSGMGINIEGDKTSFEMVPTMEVLVEYDKKINHKDVIKVFKILEDEDDSLNVKWSEEFKEIKISTMGDIHLEVLKERLEDRFRLSVEFGEPKILYKETVVGSNMGYGHFEPLGHYSEVHLLIEEGKRGSGILFENKCHADCLTVGNQNLIKTHIFEKEHKGILTGSGITDVKITLITGRAHNKHTSGGDFRESTKRALRQGLEGMENILLEPYYKFKISIQDNLYGKVLSDMQKLKCEIKDTITLDGKIIVFGIGPVQTLKEYPKEITAMSSGYGNISFKFYGYERCHNEEEIIKDRNYNKNADIEYTSVSIFCSKGESYLVQGKDVKNYIHCIE